MDTKTFATILIPTIAVMFFVFYDGDNFQNRRKDAYEASQESIENFQSKLKDTDRENLETVEDKIIELDYKTLVESESEEERAVVKGDKITVNYIGWRATDGYVFDESFKNFEDRGFSFTVGTGVIDGWSSGVVGMKQGEIRRLYIPSEKGYGITGGPDQEVIPPDTDLIFDVELIKFK